MAAKKKGDGGKAAIAKATAKGKAAASSANAKGKNVAAAARQGAKNPGPRALINPRSASKGDQTHSP